MTTSPSSSLRVDRLHETLAPALRRFVPGRGRVLDFQRDDLHPVAMHSDVVRDRVVRPERRGEDEGQFVLPDDVTGPVFDACLRPGIGEALKAERRLVKMRGLLGIADVELHVIGPLQRQKIGFGRRRWL